ncbi:MAG: hypothetical protein Q7T01_00845 [bacterium]|nr:hypothetical protein [bacterium]
MAKDPSLLPEDMRNAEEELQSAGRLGRNGRETLHIPDTALPTPRQRRGRVPAASVAEPVPPLPQPSVPQPSPLPPRPSAAPTPQPAPNRAAAPSASVIASTRKSAGRPAGQGRPAVPEEAPRLHIPKLGRKTLRAVSLIPSEFKKKPVSAKWPQLVAIVGVALSIPLIAVPWAILSNRIVDAREETRAVEARRTDVLSRIAAMEREVESYRVTAKRAVVLQSIVAQHGTWGPFFDLLEARSLPGMRYEQLTVDANGTVTLPTVAPNLRVAAAQLVAWQEEPRVQDLGLSGFSSVIDELGITRGIRFDLRMRVDPALFTDAGRLSGGERTPAAASGDEQLVPETAS